VQADCTTHGRQLRGQEGQILQVSCPAGCDVGTAPVQGTNVYTAASSVCRSGIHAGAIPPAGGTMNVRIDPARAAYRGTEQNGIRSTDHANYPTSFAVLVPGAARPPVPVAGDPVEAGCSFSARHLRGDTGSTRLVACPSGCASADYLFGTDTYSFDSSICKAAIHAGLLADKDGGTVKVTVDVGRPPYRGSVRHGVRSKDGGSDPGSFRLARP
jgi:LCCL domain